MDWKSLGCAAAATGLIGAAPAVGPVAGPDVAMVAPVAGTPVGYLGDDAPDSYKILPPPPVAGTTRYQADRTVYRETRALKDTPRWAMAQGDVDQRAVMRQMACAVGVELTPANAPTLSRLLSKLQRDDSNATNRAKDIYLRKRPYLIDEGPTCVAKTEALGKSPDYPSGHNAWGWSVGLVLAELEPDRATPILQRARAYGESRLVCGVHSLSAVEAGRLNGSIVVAALHSVDAFRSDMAAARQEIADARKAGPAPDSTTCAAEAELVAKSPY